MRVNAINYSPRQYTYNRNIKQHNVSFDGKHDCAKLLGGVFGTLGTLGAVGGTIIMTGGLAIPAILGYGALSAASGVIIGHQIDKGAEKYDKNEKKK